MTDSSIDSRFRRAKVGAGQPLGLQLRDQRVCIVVPAYQAAKTLTLVLDDLRRAFPELGAEEILVVDDGSTDGTSRVAKEAGAAVLSLGRNQGKGAALLRGFEEAHARGYGVALTVDADGQHPATSARELLAASDDPHALVLGVRNLASEHAPWANRFSNGISNFFLSCFTRRWLEDTQCGLRRYPVAETLSLGADARGYAFEAEVLLRASAAAIPIVQKEVRVHYPPEAERVTHFDSLRDPMRIIGTVLSTLHDLSGRARSPRGRP